MTRRIPTDGIDVSDRSWLGAAGALTAAAAFALTTGVWGIVSAVVVAGCWYALSPVYAFAVGQILFTALVSPNALGFEHLAIEAGLFAVLVGPVVTRETALFRLGVAATATLGLVVILELGLRWSGLWLAATGLLASFALLTYGIHRYELVALGLVEGDV